jgi:hypothetical protein
VAPLPRPNLEHVYIVFSCNYPLQNDKWGESSARETEDTQCLGVYASLRDANAHAHAEAHDDYDEDESDKDDSSDEKSKEAKPFSGKRMIRANGRLVASGWKSKR